MKLGETLGRLWFYRQKGALYLEMMRQWILPVMGASAASKYLGFSLTRSILFWVGLALLSETAAVLLGWLERRSGATRAHYDLAKQTDPYKVDALQHAKDTARELRVIRALLYLIHRRMDPPRPSQP